jgi:hypothetical protein
MTTIRLTNAAIGRGLGAPVPAMTIELAPGAPTVLAVETDERPLLVSMLLGGRLKPDSGSVTIDGSTSIDVLRKRTALVDTPVVAEPTAGAKLEVAVAEEFSFAGRSTSRRAVHRFLGEHSVDGNSVDGHSLADYADLPLRALPPTARVRLFSELALLRPDVSVLIITSPERHGGDPSEWFDSLAAIAERGTTVAIVTDTATRAILLTLGARDALAPATPHEPDASESLSA